MRVLPALVLPLLLSGAATSQTLGVAGVNNYWITPGGLPGGLSCKPLTLITPVTPMNMHVSAAPNTPYYTFWFFCGCFPCWQVPTMGISGCLPPPTSACPASNQFVEAGVITPCVFAFAIPNLTNAAGLATVSLNVPLASGPFSLSTQTVFLAPPSCVVPPWGVLFSQAWNVTFL